MNQAPTILPWFSPRLSPSLTAVLQGLGHAVRVPRGEFVYRSPELFGRLMYVRRGLVVKALLEPNHDDPILMTLSGTGGLCGSYENLYVRDHMSRAHWCVTTSELLVVNAELLLRICDQHAEWQVELSNYSSASALSDRLGLIVNHVLSPRERLGVFWILCAQQFDKEFVRKLATPGIEWVVSPVVPPRRVAAFITNMGSTRVGEILREWRDGHTLRYRSRKIYVRRSVFFEYWKALLPHVMPAAR